MMSRLVLRVAGEDTSFVTPSRGRQATVLSTRVPTRRAVLAWCFSGALLGAGLAGCAGAEAKARHPALAPPQDACVVLGLEARGEGTPARQAVLDLLARVDDSDDVGTMVGFGASLFERYADQRAFPVGLTVMPPFVGDVLDPQRTHGDLVLQVEAEDAVTAARRADELLRGLSQLQVRWQVAGRRDSNLVAGGRPLMRNPFGYVEGHGNAPALSATAAGDVLVPRRVGDPEWLAGSSFLVVRVVQLARGLWDADSEDQQDRIVGRRRDGRWLDGRAATVAPDFGSDPEGAVTPLDSHVRRANPGTPGEGRARMLRRSWAYSSGATGAGLPDEGVVFMAYQADYETGFALAQRRLQGEAMTPYMLTVGGGYFVVPARRPVAGWESIFEVGISA
jgi:deferrochelatase/peroxidase EfeB